MDSGITLAEHIATGRILRLVAVGEWMDPELTADLYCCACGAPILSGWAVEGEGPEWCVECVSDEFLAPEA